MPEETKPVPVFKKCCMCQRTDERVKTLKTETPVHPDCMHAAALGPVIEKVGGWLDYQEPPKRIAV